MERSIARLDVRPYGDKSPLNSLGATRRARGLTPQRGLLFRLVPTDFRPAISLRAPRNLYRRLALTPYTANIGYWRAAA